MNLVKGNINFTNEIIDGISPGEGVNDMLQDLISTLNDMQPKMHGMISSIDDDQVLSICLLINDDLQKTFERYHDVTKKRKPKPFVPGESLKNTFLSPTHIYNAQSTTEAAPQKSSAPTEDLFDFSSSSQPQPQQQAQPVFQQQPRQPPASFSAPQAPQVKKDDPIS